MVCRRSLFSVAFTPKPPNKQMARCPLSPHRRRRPTRKAMTRCRHREAPSGAVAISSPRSVGYRDCFAALAMTRKSRVNPPCFFF